MLDVNESMRQHMCASETHFPSTFETPEMTVSLGSMFITHILRQQEINAASRS